MSVSRVLQSDKGFECATLLLARNGISAEGARLLSSMLAINETLTSLSLYKNKIGDDGILWLSQALLGNRTLSTLNVRDNGIGEGGACGLSDVMCRLGQDCSLRLLNISENAIGPKGRPCRCACKTQT
jgi:Ran GTPase-activating protein (RanGAP) involved in mRNA processing and transport